MTRSLRTCRVLPETHPARSTRRKWNEMKEGIEESLTARSPLQRYKDVEKELEERWEDELKAAIEAEYRRQRADLLVVRQWWLRDVWLLKLGEGRKEKEERRGAVG